MVLNHNFRNTVRSTTFRFNYMTRWKQLWCDIHKNIFFWQDTSDTPQPAQKKQKTSGNVSIGKLQNKSQLASLIKVNKDKTNGQKASVKVVSKTVTVTAAQEDMLQDSQKDTGKVHHDNKAGTSALGSLGMLGDYSSSEDSDQQT